MYLQKITIAAEVWRHKHLNKDNVPSSNHQVTVRTLLVTSLLLLVQLQTTSAAPTTIGVNVNDLSATTTPPTTVKASSDDDTASSEHFFYDIPPAASTILITLFAAIFSYGLSVGIKVLCPDQCDHRGTCANNNTTSFCRRYRRTVNPLSKCSVDEKSYQSQYPLPVIGIPNGRPNYTENVQQWLEQVDHTIGVSDEPFHGGTEEIPPANFVSVMYDSEINQASIDTRRYMDAVGAKRMPTALDSGINGECATKELDNVFVVIPDLTNTDIEIAKTKTAKGTSAIEKHKHIVQVEINGCMPKDVDSIAMKDISQKREVQQKAWTDTEFRKGSMVSSPDSCGLKENEPLLISPSRTTSTPLSTPTSTSDQKRPDSMTLESIKTDDTSIGEETPRRDDGQQPSFVPIKEDTVLKSPALGVRPESKTPSSTHNTECKDKTKCV